MVLVAVKACTGPNAVWRYTRPVAATAVVVAVLLVAGCAKDQASKLEATDHPARTNAFTQPPAECVNREAHSLNHQSRCAGDPECTLGRGRRCTARSARWVVRKIARDEAREVDKGTVLVRPHHCEIQAKLDHARADLLVAENNVKYNEAELKAKEAAYRCRAGDAQAGSGQLSRVGGGR